MKATQATGVGARQQRRLAAVSGPGAFSWLTARPMGFTDSCYLSPDDSRFSYRYWLGLQLPHFAQPGAPAAYDAHDLLRGPMQGVVTVINGVVQRELLAIQGEQGEPFFCEDAGFLAHCAEPHIPDIVWGDRVSGAPWARDVVTENV